MRTHNCGARYHEPIATSAWHSQRGYGLDQRPVVLMIENYRSQFMFGTR